MASQAGLRRRHPGWSQGSQRRELHRYFKRRPDRANKLWVWNLLIFIRSLDTFPEGGSQGWERTGNSAASESVL